MGPGAGPTWERRARQRAFRHDPTAAVPIAPGRSRCRRGPPGAEAVAGERIGRAGTALTTSASARRGSGRARRASRQRAEPAGPGSSRRNLRMIPRAGPIERDASIRRRHRHRTADARSPQWESGTSTPRGVERKYWSGGPGRFSSQAAEPRRRRNAGPPRMPPRRARRPRRTPRTTHRVRAAAGAAGASLPRGRASRSPGRGGRR